MEKTASSAAHSELQPYFSRDQSWLSFNFRVLQEAMDASVPLFERLRFLAIYSSNLDEFFRVRVAALRCFRDLRKADRKALLDIKPKRELKAIRKTVQRQQETFGMVFREMLLPALAKAGVALIDADRCSNQQLTYIRQYFRREVAPLIKVTPFSAETDIPFLENRALYFVAATGEAPMDFLLLNIPSDQCPRFVELPATSTDTRFLIYLDDIIRYCLHELLPPGNEYEAYAVKVSRDAELYIDNEFSGDLLQKLREALDQREAGAPTRFLFDQRMPATWLSHLKQLLGLSKYDLIPGGRYHNFHDFFSFPDPWQNPAFHFPPWPPLLHPGVEAAAGPIMEQVRTGDLLLHFPYQRFAYLTDLLLEAANDPLVSKIRLTLYRAAPESKVMEGLMRALQLGKRVEVFIEAKARFDEEANLRWGKTLAGMGAQVRYSFPGIKVHAKLLLIEQQDGGRLAYIGTGNFNEKTAKLYGDHALLTAHPALTEEVRKVFEWLNGQLAEPSFEHLLVAPHAMRERLLQLIDREIEHARGGQPAYLWLKMNSLEEKSMIDKLYEASRAGVSIRLIVRGICCLRPGLPGLSEHIEVISILDRYLEHARIWIFGNWFARRSATR
ncbi:MAG: polyphosphate kinase 1, partial [Lewinella sp.]|nr:polyphosphate kinase 1 [Lewinella sp.]